MFSVIFFGLFYERYDWHESIITELVFGALQLDTHNVHAKFTFSHKNSVHYGQIGLFGNFGMVTEINNMAILCIQLKSIKKLGQLC